MWRDELAYLFPIRSLTPDRDRHWLGQLFDLVRTKHQQYRYLEVGSYVGGTLTPALLDERCTGLLSIDTRPAVQPDSRNASYDYSKVQTATMIETLKAHGLTDLKKMRTFDGSARDCDFGDQKFHLAFIDAEHTDEAVFADFLAVYDHLEPEAICAFHDANLVTSGLENIRTFLEYQGREHAFMAFRSSWMAAVFLDQPIERLPGGLLTHAADWAEFKSKSRDDLLLSAIRNRCAVNFTLKPKPLLPP